MATEIKTLAPAAVWGYFYDLTQIPRPTGHTLAAQDYVLALAVWGSRPSGMLWGMYWCTSPLRQAWSSAPS